MLKYPNNNAEKHRQKQDEICELYPSIHDIQQKKSNVHLPFKVRWPFTK